MACVCSLFVLSFICIFICSKATTYEKQWPLKTKQFTSMLPCIFIIALHWITLSLTMETRWLCDPASLYSALIKSLAQWRDALGTTVYIGLDCNVNVLFLVYVTFLYYVHTGVNLHCLPCLIITEYNMPLSDAHHSQCTCRLRALWGRVSSMTSYWDHWLLPHNDDRWGREYTVAQMSVWMCQCCTGKRNKQSII